MNTVERAKVIVIDGTITVVGDNQDGMAEVKIKYFDADGNSVCLLCQSRSQRQGFSRKTSTVT